LLVGLSLLALGLPPFGDGAEDDDGTGGFSVFEDGSTCVLDRDGKEA